MTKRQLVQLKVPVFLHSFFFEGSQFAQMKLGVVILLAAQANQASMHKSSIGMESGRWALLDPK
jgi:hypothetical protein